jgi:translation initiation factor 1 (eIF-1/SUI1)
LSLLALNGCGSDDTTNSSISGKVVDGYVKHAKVCVDLNNNFLCDENEPFTYTDNNGNYLLNIENKNYILISIGGIDTQTNAPALTMYSNTKYKNITPLTSLAIKYGEDVVAKYFNIDKSKIAADPMKDNEIKNIVNDIVNTKIIKGDYILDVQNISNHKEEMIQNNENLADENTSINNIQDENNSIDIQNDKNSSITENLADENTPPEIIGELTPPLIR